MAESRMKGRVRGLLGGAAEAPEEMHEPLVAPPIESYRMPADPDAQRQALQVLTLAQKTADEHLATVQREADTIRANARQAAEQVAKEAQNEAANTRRDAEKVLTDARAKAAEIEKAAQAKAAELEREAQQRYDEVVGTLDTKRAALEEKIEGLQRFDRDYRTRLRSFMQRQLHDLDNENAAPPAGGDGVGGGPVPAPARAGTTGVQRVGER